MKNCKNCRNFRVALDAELDIHNDSCQVIGDIDGQAPEKLLFVMEQVLFQMADKGECPLWQQVRASHIDARS